MAVGADRLAGSAAIDWRQVGARTALGLTIVLLGLAATETVVLGAKITSLQGALGVDFHQYQDHARRWLAGGGFYLGGQLAGPYSVWDLLPPLYPPTFLLVIVPFVWLPEPLWWAIPLCVMSLAVVRHQPARWAWPILAALLLLPRTPEIVYFGNPSLWVAGAVAAGTLWGWPAVFAILKPTLAPFALVGIRRRSWWIAAAGLVLVSVPFGSMWLDYLAATRNATDVDLLYSLRDVPIVAIPVVAWIARRPPSKGRSGARPIGDEEVPTAAA